MPKPLSHEELCRHCDPERLPFQSTGELADLEEVIGQERAMEALRFATGIRHDGYNLFALGPTGVGKHRAVMQYLTARAHSEPVPPDLCYVNNFDDTHKPRALLLPPGRGVPLRKDMERFVEELRVAIPAAFESEDYRTRRRILEKEMEDRHEQTFGAIQKRAQDRHIALLRTPVGLALAPVRDGEVMGPEAIGALSAEEQQKMQADMAELQGELQAALQSVPKWQREIRLKVRELKREVLTHAVAHLAEELRRSYADLPQVLGYLEAVHKDLVDRVDDFVPAEDGGEGGAGEGEDAEGPEEDESFRNYLVNVLVDHAQQQGAPVVYEDHPTHSNLVGRVEHIAQYGALLTDFNLIKPGALHRANGGYLVLDIHKVLQHPLAWDELKRALLSRAIRIESLEQALSLVSTVSLEPEPIPLDIKVVLAGERTLYYLLDELDPDFPALFKVAADFEEHLPRTADNELLFARLLATLARRDRLLPLQRDAVARVIEQAARLLGDSDKVSTHLRSLGDLLREADYYARLGARDAVAAADVQRAIDAQVHRQDRLRGQLQEETRNGVILIDTRGEKVGQVNGLTYLQLGQFAFGRPVRITARVRLGRGEVVDIERAVELGGPIHSKGVLILSSFLRSRYVPEHPFSLSASLVFEQSYGGVEGDSASTAELYALLSALSGVPARQSLAVTGSMNQNGEVQAIGGVNEKIEGFFDLCRELGLSGDQGVLIPAANVRHLMLRRDVVEAVRAGRFQVYPIRTVDEGIEVLCGVPAGERDTGGRFPPGSINQRVEARLLGFGERARRFAALGRPARAEGTGEADEADLR